MHGYKVYSNYISSDDGTEKLLLTTVKDYFVKQKLIYFFFSFP